MSFFRKKRSVRIHSLSKPQTSAKEWLPWLAAGIALIMLLAILLVGEVSRILRWPPSPAPTVESESVADTSFSPQDRNFFVYKVPAGHPLNTSTTQIKQLRDMDDSAYDAWCQYLQQYFTDKQLLDKSGILNDSLLIVPLRPDKFNPPQDTTTVAKALREARGIIE